MNLPTRSPSGQATLVTPGRKSNGTVYIQYLSPYLLKSFKGTYLWCPPPARTLIILLRAISSQQYVQQKKNRDFIKKNRLETSNFQGHPGWKSWLIHNSQFVLIIISSERVIVPIQCSVSIQPSDRSNRQCQSSLPFRSNLHYRFNHQIRLNFLCRSSPSVSIQPCMVETEKKKRESNQIKQTECWAVSSRSSRRENKRD